MPSIDDPASYTSCEDPLQTYAPSEPFDKEQLRASDADLPESLLKDAPAGQDNYDFTAHPSPQIEGAR
jgi:hypothetical protein